MSPAAVPAHSPHQSTVRTAFRPLFAQPKDGHVVRCPANVNPFEFVIMSALRTAQLVRGCTPRLESGHKKTTTAQMEVAAGKVVRAADPLVVPVV